MADELKQALITRATMPNNAARVPPRIQRWETAQKMISGYQNGWQPPPLLTRIIEGK